MCNKITTAIILASGKGTRLKPFTEKTAKPLIKVNHKPLISFVLDNLIKAEIKEAIITVRYFPKHFDRLLGDSYKGISLKYVKLPLEPVLGAAGDMKKAENYIDKNETFLVCNADIITNADFKKFIASHFNSKCAASISVINQNEYKTGSIGVSKEGYLATFYRYKYFPVARHVTFASQQILNKKHFDLIPSNEFFGFFGDDDLYPRLIDQGDKVNCFEYDSDTFWLDAGTPELLARAGDKRANPLL